MSGKRKVHSYLRKALASVSETLNCGCLLAYLLHARTDW
jgi:hypothetical protein